MRDLGAERGVFLRVLEEVHDLPQFLFLLLCSGHIIERDLFLAVLSCLYPGLAEAVYLASAAGGLVEEHDVKHDEDDADEHVRKYRHPPGDGMVGLIFVILDDPVGVLLLDQFAQVLPEVVDVLELVGDLGGLVLQLHCQDVVVVDLERFDLLLLKECDDVAVFERILLARAEHT